MEKLKSILGLKFIRNIPKENKMAYLVSVGMGIGAGVLVTIIPSFFSYGTGLENNIFAFAAIAPVIVATIIFLLILINKFPVVWENIKIRFICIILMLISYIYMRL